MNYSELKKKAREQLKINKPLASKAVAFNFIIALVFLIPYLMANQLHVSWINEPLRIIFYIVYGAYAGFLAPVFSIAIVTFIAQIAKQSESADENNLTLDTYFNNFHLAGKGIGNYWWTYLWTCLWGLLAMVPTIILLVVLTLVVNPAHDSPSLVSSLVPFLVLLCYLPIIIYKTLSYCMNTYIIADKNETGVVDALDISKAITKGHRGELFGFYMSFFGWYVLELITLGIASIWIEPYIKMSVYNFYKELAANYKPETPETINAPESENPYSL